MQAISDIDFAKIKLTPPTYIGVDGKGVNAPFSGDAPVDMRFVRVFYPRRTPLLSFSGEVVECVDSEYGLYCLVKPDTKFLVNFELLESLLEPDNSFAAKLTASIGWVDGKYTHRPTLNDSFQIRLKMQTKDNGNWKFETPARDAADAESIFVEGARVTATVSPGFYFNDSDSMYGMFATLKSLHLEGGQVSATPTPKKASRVSKK